MNVGIGTDAALFPEKEYIMEIYFAVQCPPLHPHGYLHPTLLPVRCVHVLTHPQFSPFFWQRQGSVGHCTTFVADLLIFTHPCTPFPLPLEYPCPPPPQTTGSMPGICHHAVACSRSFLPVLANNWALTQWRWCRANISCKRSGREVSRLLFAGVGEEGGWHFSAFLLLKREDSSPG